MSAIGPVVPPYSCQAPTRRRLPPAWRIVLAVAALDIVWIQAGGWSVTGREGLIPVLAGSGTLFPLLMIERYRSDLRLRSTLLAVLLLIAFSLAASVLSDLAVSAGQPLIDRQLAAWDCALGFNWLTAEYWVAAHPGVEHAFRLAYDSGLFQIGFVVLFLGLTARIRQLEEFIGLYIGGLLLAIAVSLFFPAAGPWLGAPASTPFDASVLSHFVPLRSGSLRAIDFSWPQGLISMPSVHAMLAIFLIHAMRGTGWPLPGMTALNLLMLASTPTVGGHYLVDVIAGILCAVAMIALSRRLARAAPPGALQADQSAQPLFQTNPKACRSGPGFRFTARRVAGVARPWERCPVDTGQSSCLTPHAPPLCAQGKGRNTPP